LVVVAVSNETLPQNERETWSNSRARLKKINRMDGVKFIFAGEAESKNELTSLLEAGRQYQFG